MFPNNPHKTYEHKQSKRMFRVTGIETLQSTKTYFKAHRPTNYKGKYYTFNESGNRTRTVLSVQYLDDKQYESWLIDFDYTFMKVIKPAKTEKDENAKRYAI